MADLREFLDQNTPRRQGPNFDDLAQGRYLHRLQTLHQDVAAYPTIFAVCLWQIAIETEAFVRVGRTLELGYERDLKIVSHGDPHHPEIDLLVLDPTLDTGPKSLRLQPRPMDLITAHKRWMMARLANLDELRKSNRLPPYTESELRALIGRVIDSDFAVQLFDAYDFRVVAARKPLTIYTSLPAVPWRVVPGSNPSAFASAGAVVRSLGNPTIVGVTIPAHALLPNGPANPVGWSVDVNNQSGTVVSCDVVSDSCFVELPHIGPPSHIHKASQGPAGAALAPAVGTVGCFEGCATPGCQSGRVTAVNVNIFGQHPLVQQRFDLNRLTNVGDSGCALVDSNGFILGFALSCTTPTSNPSFSTWIWADSVFAVHQIRAF